MTTVSKATAHRARFKLLGAILTTYGYAILGLAVLQPMLAGSHNLSVYQVVGLLIGLAVQSYAIYIAPYGEVLHEPA